MHAIEIEMLTPKALDNPLLLAERTAVVLLDPQLHTAVMEGVVTLSPYN